MGHGLEQGLVYGDLRVGVNRVVSDVQILGDLGLRKLFNNAFSWLLIFNELTGNLLNRLRVMRTYFLHRLEFEWFSQSFIALFYINLLTITKKLPLFKKKDIKNHYFFFDSSLTLYVSQLSPQPFTYSSHYRYCEGENGWDCESYIYSLIGNRVGYDLYILTSFILMKTLYIFIQSYLITFTLY